MSDNLGGQSMTEDEWTIYDNDGGLDEIRTSGGCFLERLSKKGWLLSCIRADGSELSVWFRGKVELTEERPAPARIDAVLAAREDKP